MKMLKFLQVSYALLHMFFPVVAFIFVLDTIPAGEVRTLSIVAIFILFVLNVSQLMDQFSGGLPESKKEMLKLLFLPIFATVIQAILLGTDIWGAIILLNVHYLSVRMLALFISMAISPFHAGSRDKIDWAIYFLVLLPTAVIPLWPIYVMGKITIEAAMQESSSLTYLTVALIIFTVSLLAEVKKLVFVSGFGINWRGYE